MNQLQPLIDLADHGLQPIGRQVWIGLGFRPSKKFALALDPDNLPAPNDCWPVVGLDIIVTYQGSRIRYGVLRSLCHALQQANPRRLFAVDVERPGIAYLKLENK